jgi:dolichyl-phosphate-mannose--protein O-mannosyl transferase
MSVWDKGYVVAWYAVVSLVVLYELYTLFDKRASTPPFTQVVVQTVPGWITIPFLVWLLVHFASRYLGKPVL